MHVVSASPHEVTLVESTLEYRFTEDVPQRLIGDKAYDSDALDVRLALDWGVEMIAPNRAKRCRTQDGRPLRRYCRRWKVERLFAALRRLLWNSPLFKANFPLGSVQELMRTTH